MICAYIRVSCSDQSTRRQEEALKSYGIEKYFIEKASGKDMNRPELQKCLDFCRENDVLYILDFSRIARSTKNLLDIVEYLQQKNVTLISVKENINTSTPQGRLMLTMIGAIYTFERENMLERQREGIAIAKEEGKYKGRKAISIENFGEWYKMWQHRIYSKTQLARELGISRQTLYKLFEEYEKANQPETQQ